MAQLYTIPDDGIEIACLSQILPKVILTNSKLALMKLVNCYNYSLNVIMSKWLFTSRVEHDFIAVWLVSKLRMHVQRHESYYEFV